MLYQLSRAQVCAQRLRSMPNVVWSRSREKQRWIQKVRVSVSREVDKGAPCVLQGMSGCLALSVPGTLNRMKPDKNRVDT